MGKTFRSICTELYGPLQPEQEPSALGMWFDSVCDVPIEELEIEDLCRAVRQDICISHLLPIAISELDKDVLVGFMIDAELLSGVRGLPLKYWRIDPLLAQKMLAILIREKELIASDPDAVGFSGVLEANLRAVLLEVGA